jgi:transcriptional regulator with XRE-family HTH domain
MVSVSRLELTMQVNWFGPRLKELRTKAGLTQVQLAEKAGLSAMGISQLKFGRRTPSWDTVMALAVALGVDCSAFQIAAVGGKERAKRGGPKRIDVKAAKPRRKK